MGEGNISQEFRYENIVKMRNGSYDSIILNPFLF